MKQETKVLHALVESLLFRIDEKTEMISICLGRLSETEIWKRPNAASNSMGNLILHLCGNVSQYIIAGLGNQKDVRERDAEFNATGGYSGRELMTKLNAVMERAKAVIRSLPPEGWIKVYRVQGFTLTGIGIALHVVEHYAYHTGQIAYWTKLLKANDLGFYDGMDLNEKNE